MLTFERLDAWKVCHELALAAFRVVRSLPESSDSDLLSDLVRSAILAPAKIARGSGTRSRRMFLQCVALAAGHLAELAYYLRLANDLGVLPADKWQELDALRGRAAFYTWKLLDSFGPEPDSGASAGV
jgi:four helix bundle protein